MTEQRLKELMHSAYLWAKVFQSSNFDEFLQTESIKEALMECEPVKRRISGQNYFE